MSSSTTPPYLYILGGLLAIYAAYTTHSQLQAFRTRCVSKPPQQSNDAAVDRSTEDGSSSDMRMAEQILTMPSAAIKLETLEALARGINFDLRNAALKIITERATTPGNIDFLLTQISTRPPAPRLRALKALRCLAAAPGPFGALCTPRVFRTLVTTLKSTLPPTPDSATEKEVIYILTQLMKSYFAAKEMAVQAGIVDWLKAVDRSVVDVWEVLSCVNDTMEGRRLLVEAELVQEERVEVEVEVDFVDVNQWLPAPANIVADQ
ncbi:uncharacterized protein H6S33_002776 [Morchella sextelata]|uniref:uncharacterized protein n=1 Tax=Morchella sextelata TaxID=1174677 RepID=UPI001D043460|nr:uncharacterized protein H6S33_002776 [Morchella sextelata]KAH0607742.1 hypothetical protein H6S33_002776 [Morchella sextelata]